MKAQGGDIEGATDRSVRPLGQSAFRPDRAVRGRRRSGRRLVHGPVLRTLLPREDPQGGWRDHQHPHRHRARDRHALLHLLRLAERQDRPQADHPRRLRARGGLLFPAVSCAATNAANLVLAHAQANAPVQLTVNPDRCSVQFDPVGRNKFDRTPATWPRPGSPRRACPMRAAPGPMLVQCPTWSVSGSVIRKSASSTVLSLADPASRADTVKAFQAKIKAAVDDAGHPAKADPAAIEHAAGHRDPGRARAAGDNGLRTDRRDAGRALPEPHSLYRRCPCPITSATAGSAAFCQRQPSRWSRQPATFTTAFGIRSSSHPSRLVIGLFFLPETAHRKIDD